MSSRYYETVFGFRESKSQSSSFNNSNVNLVDSREAIETCINLIKDREIPLNNSVTVGFTDHALAQTPFEQSTTCMRVSNEWKLNAFGGTLGGISGGLAPYWKAWSIAEASYAKTIQRE
jgi:hypothetical protein